MTATYTRPSNTVVDFTDPTGDKIGVAAQKLDACFTDVYTDLNLIDVAVVAKATLVSPAFTGTPTAPTATPATGTTQIATTAYVDLADAFKAPLANPAFTGTPTAPTAAPLTSTTQLATTAYTDLAVAVMDTAKAPLASPHFTGVPTSTTAATGTDTTQIATTAFVQQVSFNSALPSQVGQGGKFVQTDGDNASWQYVPSSTYTFETAGGF